MLENTSTDVSTIALKDINQPVKHIDMQCGRLIYWKTVFESKVNDSLTTFEGVNLIWNQMNFL